MSKCHIENKHIVIYLSTLFLVKTKEILFINLYFDELSHMDKCNKDELVHYIFQGVTGRNFQIMMFF